ncbi:MAG: NYN domain-containing protein [Phycisphaerales bacterium]
MSLLIDTMNVLHAWTGLRTGAADLTPHGLARVIGSSRYAGRRLRLVCDGSAPGDWADRVEWPLDASGRVTAIYAGAGREADDILESLLRDDPGARHTLVISDDRRVQRAARRRKAKQIGSRAFLHQILGDARAEVSRDGGSGGLDRAGTGRDDGPLPESSVRSWLRYFRFTGGEAGMSEGDGAPEGEGGQDRGAPEVLRRAGSQERSAGGGRGGKGPGGASRGGGRADGRSGRGDGSGSARAKRNGMPGGPVGGDSELDPSFERLIRDAIADGVRIDPEDLEMERWLE